MIPSDYDLRWELEPHIVAIDYQHQVIVLDFRLVVQEVEYATDLSCVSSLIPAVSIEFFAIIYQCRWRVAEDEGG